MLLEEVTIRNVGLFRHSHTINLAPPSPRRPIVLIGGLNGSGKTTLLDSIQLVLYGKRARCSNRGTLAYEEYLRRSINSAAIPHEEASITLQFRQWSNGREHVYRVRRAWMVTSTGVSEHVAVLRDNSLDRVLTDTWMEVVEEIIPSEISHLFFFDGEKIESFADIESSKQLLAKAVHSLLGLDVVNRLNADLVALERRKHTALKTDVERRQIDDAKAEIKQLDEQRDDLLVLRATKQNDLDRRLKDLREAETLYEKSGGLLFEQREKLEEGHSSTRQTLQEVEKELRGCAEGVAPLLIVQDLLANVSEQLLREETAAEAQIVLQVLSERDEQLLEVAKSYKIPRTALDALVAFLGEDRKRRSSSSENVAAYLQLSVDGRQDLRDLRSVVLAQAHKQIEGLLLQANELQSHLIDLERKLASVPAEDFIVEVTAKRRTAQTEADEVRAGLAEIDAEIKRINELREQKHSKMVAQIEKAVEGQFESEDAQRIIIHSKRIRETLGQFRTSVVERHVNRIATLVLDSFRRLLRKESLISDLKIDMQTFALDLRSAEGKVLSPDRLSAGERQLLAVSMLWGLARASGRPLPVVIDTPLGRLDASHRGKLVASYFPHASHQVLLLSTDKEIDSEYFERLKPFIGHAYHLEYNDSTSTSQIKPGYFWEDAL